MPLSAHERVVKGPHVAPLPTPDANFTPPAIQINHTHNINIHNKPTTAPLQPPPPPAPYLNASFCHTQNARHRPTMEDASKIISNFQNAPGNGYFSVFDGHAGSFSAKWCAKFVAQRLARYLTLFASSQELMSTLSSVEGAASQDLTVPAILAGTFEQLDAKLCGLPEYDGSGCTAAVAYIKNETTTTGQEAAELAQVSFSPLQLSSLTPSSFQSPPLLASSASPKRRRYSLFSPNASPYLLAADAPSKSSTLRQKLYSPQLQAQQTSGKAGSHRPKRTLYTANVGDSRILLCRNGVAHRLTVDHKATDASEIERIRKTGGSVFHGRVDGSLAVTRAFGDSRFKPYVNARPYTTQVELDPDLDEFIVLACDGVGDVLTDQAVVDLVREIEDPAEASQEVVRQALFKGSADNITCMVVRLKKVADCLIDDGHKENSRNLTTSEPISIPHTVTAIQGPQGRRHRPVQPPASPPKTSLNPIMHFDTVNLNPDQIEFWKKTPGTSLQVPNAATASTTTGARAAGRHPISPAESDLLVTSSEDDTAFQSDEDTTLALTNPAAGANADPEEDDFILGDVDFQQPPAPPGTSPRPTPVHVRSYSFSPIPPASITAFRQNRARARGESMLFAHQDHQDQDDYQEQELDTAVSSLDRYGRFRVPTRLEFEYAEDDDCAIADSD